MKNLIVDLRDFFQPTSGNPGQIDLHANLDALLLLCKKTFQTNKIISVKKYCANLPLIMAVADQLKQVFLNLLNNAIDACANGGIITVTTERIDKNNIAVHIEDKYVSSACSGRRFFYSLSL